MGRGECELIARFRQEESREYNIKESALCRAILAECKRAKDIMVRVNCSKVMIDLEFEHTKIAYKIDKEIYTKIKSQIYKIKNQ